MELPCVRELRNRAVVPVDPPLKVRRVRPDIEAFGELPQLLLRDERRGAEESLHHALLDRQEPVEGFEYLPDLLQRIVELGSVEIGFTLDPAELLGETLVKVDDLEDARTFEP